MSISWHILNKFVESVKPGDSYTTQSLQEAAESWFGEPIENVKAKIQRIAQDLLLRPQERAKIEALASKIHLLSSNSSTFGFFQQFSQPLALAIFNAMINPQELLPSEDTYENYKTYKNLLRILSPQIILIQEQPWSSEMIRMLMDSQTTFQGLREELNKRYRVGFESDNPDSVKEIGPYEKYLLMSKAPAFVPLFTGGFQEEIENYIPLKRISEQAFLRVIKDLTDPPSQDKPTPDESKLLLEQAIFCKEYELEELAAYYDEKASLSSDQSYSIQEVLDLNQIAAVEHLEKLHQACQNKLSIFLRLSIQQGPSEFKKTLDQLSLYSKTITSFQLKNVHLPKDYLTEIIKNFPYLEHLELPTEISFEDLQVLQQLPHLCSLDLSNCNMTDEKLKELSKISQLTQLNLSGCKEITDTGLSYLSSFRGLTSLNLQYHYRLTEKGLAHLASLTLLTSLSLVCCYGVTGTVLKRLSPLTHLTSLNLNSCFKVRGDDLNQLSAFPEVETLDFSYCPLTDEDLNHLPDLKKLTFLNLKGCQTITSAGLSALTHRFPGLFINHALIQESADPG